MRLTIQATGISPLVVHNERLADPLDTITRSIPRLSKKRGKTIQDHEELGRLEWHGSLYTAGGTIEADDNGELIIPPTAAATIPSWNFLRCIQDGARRTKRGKDIPRGVHPLTEGKHTANRNGRFLARNEA